MPLVGKELISKPLPRQNPMACEQVYSAVSDEITASEDRIREGTVATATWQIPTIALQSNELFVIQVRILDGIEKT